MFSGQRNGELVVVCRYVAKNKSSKYSLMRMLGTLKMSHKVEKRQQ